MFKFLVKGILSLVGFFAPIFQMLAYRCLPKRREKITELNEWDAQKYRFILVYVGFATAIDDFAKNYLRDFKERGAYVVFVTNNPTFKQPADASAWMDVFIDNGNQGWDFAQYKTATKYLMDRLGQNVPSKIVYANDSIFYVKRDRSSFVDRLLNESFDFVGAFEISGVARYSPWHVSGWLYSVSRELFLSGQFQGFWSRYIPIKNKRHAIRKGEHKLTQAALSFSGKYDVIYSNAYLIEALKRSVENRGQLEASDLISTAFHDLWEQKFWKAMEGEGVVPFVAQNLYRFSPLHVFLMLLLIDEGFPFIKKDLFWLNSVTYDKLVELDKVLRSISSDDMARKIKAFFLRKGRISEADLKTKFLVHAGLR